MFHPLGPAAARSQATAERFKQWDKRSAWARKEEVEKERREREMAQQRKEVLPGRKFLGSTFDAPVRAHHTIYPGVRGLVGISEI